MLLHSISKILIVLVSISTLLQAMVEERWNTVLTLLERQALYEIKQGNIYLFDGMPGNNQCHINALIVGHIYQEWLISKNDALLEQNKRYLALNLLLCSAFSSYPERIHLAYRIRDILKATANGISNSIVKPKNCVQMLISKNSTLSWNNEEFLLQAKKELAHMTMHYIRSLLENVDSDAIELKKVADQIGSQEEITVYPKLPGVLLFLTLNKLYNIPVVLRAKHICNHATTVITFWVQDNSIVPIDSMQLPANTSVPIIVIDTIASAREDVKMFTQFNEIRKQCPGNFLFPAGSKKGGHTCCVNCNVSNQPACSCLANWKEELLSLRFDEVMMAIAACFMQTLQPHLLETLHDCKHLLTLLSKSLVYACEHHTSTNDIKCLFIEHMYPATIAQLQQKRLTDSSTQELYIALKK